jgi:phage terminase large subunit GpA-like protein
MPNGGGRNAIGRADFPQTRVRWASDPAAHITVSEWADEFRVLSPEASSEPGKWSTARVEPSRGIMDAFADPDTEIITAMVAAQTVKTEVINNVTGYHVHLDPCPMLILQPTLQMAEAYSKDLPDRSRR